MKKYDFAKIEKHWQKEWEKEQVYFAQDKSKKEKKYILVEFPYPSGEGLHVGHLRPYVAGDVYSRFLRMKGYEVMYPIGWDAFGLPAENYAIQQGIHPAITTVKNIKNVKVQLKSWGIGFDWSREVNTTDPEYYKWTQWIFLQLYKAGLVYEARGFINWCPKDKTGLANEEVVGGCCERCGVSVEKKELRQWYLKITDYAEKLLEGLKKLDWPEKIKIQQENWIGKSEGAEIDFKIKDGVAPFYVLLHGYTGSPSSNFFPWLKRELERCGAKVYAPKLPNTDDPRVYDQVEAVLKSVPFDKNTVLVGHSLGGVVAMKILEQLKKPVKKTILVSSFTKNTFITEPFEPYAFDWKFDEKKIRVNAGIVHVLRDTTDDTVPRYQADNIKQLIGGIIFDFTANEPHASGDKEPEILRHCIDSLQVFTTRPDTLFGATYMVLAPEHELIRKLEVKITNYGEVKKYISEAREKSEEERTNEKIGVELKGIKAINPANKKEIPVFVADYVLSGYGTGAIMAVPAHDERDFEFAKKYNLEIKKVILPVLIKNPLGSAQGVPLEVAIQSECWIGDGQLINSGKFDGMDSEKAKYEITKFVGGKKKIQYRLRDWVFSRQRYWGEPIPLVHCEKCGVVPVPERGLPILLPEVKRYEPTGTGESPLAVIDSWVNTKCPKCGGGAKRETNTMPQWAGSSWYYLRYADPNNKKEFANIDLLKYWLPVDAYFGGMEHTTLHLLYSRFWHEFLYNQKFVPTPEPYIKRIPHGIILGSDGEKMSKSRGNVVNPNETIKKFGADSLRMYELFLGPHEAAVSWNEKGILGISRFLERVNKFFQIKNKNSKDDESIKTLLHKTIKKATEDINEYKFNTAISALMVLLNNMEGKELSREIKEIFLKLLNPFAPYLVEELWYNLGNKNFIQKESWPEFDEKYLKEDSFELVIQVNGKHRATIVVGVGIKEDEAQKLALAQEKVKNFINNQKIKKVIFVPNRLINFVV
ncbi:MAG: alpha/beta fold hydrolase [Patescibacteria group bacterium]|nr:alpha/beta fold hydrolase [Patescibacteria group bacterium]